MQSIISIRGARTHNLRNVSLDLPKNCIIAITGRSGSGKSSLAIDTLFAEGQRQFVESLSIYTRQFFQQLPKADVDQILGLPPTVCIDQKRSAGNRRSIVGTSTEIYDYLRMLLAQLGVVHCQACQIPIRQHSPEQIAQQAMELPEGTRLMVLAPLTVPPDRPGAAPDPAQALNRIRRERLVRVRINGRLFDIEDVPPLDPDLFHQIEAVIDRIVIRPDGRPRLLEAIDLGIQIAEGNVLLSWLQAASAGSGQEDWQDDFFCTRFECPQCGKQSEEVQPQLFSFNHPLGACPTCQGLGEVDSEEDSTVNFPNLCPECEGSRLSPAARAVQLAGLNLADWLAQPIRDLIPLFQQIDFPENQQEIGTRLMAEILRRLNFLNEVGVGYLSLGRSIRSLSGGEHQRVRLSTALGSGLAQVGYILDEPTSGLHPRDNDRLISALRKLQQQGNTVVLVEHDEGVIRAADYIVDLGPQAGIGGGTIVAAGSLVEITNCPASLTGDYLAGRVRIARSRQKGRKEQMGNPLRLQPLVLRGATGRNLKNVDVAFPLNLLVLVTGVSGSGKSTLITQTLVPAVKRALSKRPGDSTASACPGQPYRSLEGVQQIERIAVVDQSPPAEALRGCPATVVGVLDSIRKIFAATRQAKQLGFNPSRFSFNSKTGWCPDCRGLGVQRVELRVLPDFFVDCETCRGRRYNLQTLQVKFNGHSIADVLDMSIQQASRFWDGFEQIAQPLRLLGEVGLGYLKLGQPATTLSGGESQRLKLAAELGNSAQRNTLFVLDEPTTGLHYEDIRLLLIVLDRLLDQGNSLVVIEHNLDLVRVADWIIDVGPEGGEQGGEIVFSGSPMDLLENRISHTGRCLKQKSALEAGYRGSNGN
jgi:excinuclease ABC subunit A